tara:strand:+ start:155 stop:316 length:162 start_codon:yes stop_codon:yes gene_type:complete
MIRYSSQGAFVRQDFIARVFNNNGGGCTSITTDGQTFTGDYKAEEILKQMRVI